MTIFRILSEFRPKREGAQLWSLEFERYPRECEECAELEDSEEHDDDVVSFGDTGEPAAGCRIEDVDVKGKGVISEQERAEGEKADCELRTQLQVVSDPDIAKPQQENDVNDGCDARHVEPEAHPTLPIAC